MNTLSFAADSILELMPKDDVWIGDIPYIVDRFARGGMGFVALLRRDDSRRPEKLSFVHGVNVAVKALLPSNDDPVLRQLFNRELTLWAGLSHPTIVNLNVNVTHSAFDVSWRVWWEMLYWQTWSGSALWPRLLALGRGSPSRTSWASE